MSDPAQVQPPPKVKRIFWRQGVRRIFYALSVLYFGIWVVVGFNWINEHPYFLGDPPQPRAGPSRALSPSESQNPRVQMLLSLVTTHEDGGIAYNQDLLRQYFEDQRSYTAVLPIWQKNAIQESFRRFNADRTRYVVLPDPHGEMIAFPGTMQLTQLHQALEQMNETWRWPIHLDYSGACLLNGAYGCYESTYGPRPFPVDLQIHCRANLDASAYLSQRNLDVFLREACGEVGWQLYEKATDQRDSSRRDFGNMLGVMIGVWLAVFAFGKVFWWVIDGFSGKHSRFDRTAA